MAGFFSSLHGRWMVALLGTVFLMFFPATNALASSRDARAIQSQIPARHAIMRVIRGDLNMDGRPDALVIVRSWDEALNADVPRPLLVFIRQPNGALRRVARADGVIGCRGCGGLAGDPWRRDHSHGAFITMGRGVFTVAEFAGSGWRGWRIVTFRYDPRVARWFLESCRSKVFYADHTFSPEFSSASRVDFGVVLLEQFGLIRGCWK